MSEPVPARKRDRATRTTRVLMALTVLGGVTFLGATAAVVWMVQDLQEAKVEDDSFLEVHLQGALRDAPEQGGFLLDPAEAPPTVTEIARAIRKAGDDERIRGLYLDLDDPSAGWASIGEIRSAIDAFQAKGKPCVAYSESYDTKGYWLASTCDDVLLAPGGLALVNGVALSITYYAGTLEKVGAVGDFEHVGDFKSAVEPFQRTGPSEPASEAVNYLLDGIWAEVVAGIAEGRGVSEAQVQAWVDGPTLAPGAARAAGFVDGLAYRDAVRSSLPRYGEEGWVRSLDEVDREPTGDDAPTFTSLDAYVDTLRASDEANKARIALVCAEGQIVSGSADGGFFGGDGLLADKTFRSWMQEIREDDDIHAVVLRVNSPGGSGLAADMMWREIQLTRAAGKPVVVSMGDYAASGGYYIAAPADWVVAQPGTLTGSIGVFGGKLALAGMWEKLGMTEFTYRRGMQSDLFTASAPFTEGGRVAFRSFLQDFYDRFLDVVADGRGMERDAAHAVAQGRVWTGRQAKERGLVDEIGGIDVALAKAAELGDLEAYGVSTFPASKTLWDQLAEDLEVEALQPRLEIPGVDSGAMADLVRLERVLSDSGVAALLPGHWDIR